MRRLIGLGEGAYSVSEVCRILQPTMTHRKVHYWLNTGLLSDPVRKGGQGTPTILSFQQLLEIRTVQHLRDDLNFSLPRVRDAISWILTNLFVDEGKWTGLSFYRGTNGQLTATTGTDTVVVPGGQGVLPGTLESANATFRETRTAWDQRLYAVPRHPHVVTNARIMAGAPTIRGSRIETALIASFVSDDGWNEETVADIVELYPRLSSAAIRDALEFEGLLATA